MRFFLDANVIFSAAYLDESRPGALFALARAKWIELCASKFVVDEARRNLARKKAGRLAALDALIGELPICTEPSRDLINWAHSQGLPAKDAPVLAAAIGAQADFLVTGDRQHFGDLLGKQFGITTIVLPVDALDHALAHIESRPRRR